MLSLENLVAYSAQFGVLTVTALLIVRLVRLRAPLPSLRFWHAILAASILLPFLQPAAPINYLVDATPAMRSLVAATPAAPISTSIDLRLWLIYIVAVGAGVNVLWLALGLLRLRTIRRHAEATAAFDPLLADLSASLQATATIAVSDDVETPATIGVKQPLILVPRRLLGLPEGVQRAVLAHELIHVRRRDWLHTIGEEIWCALLWFHPAARVVAARLSLARETVVDEATILLTRDRRAYAAALLAFANPQPHLPGVIALIGRRQLSQRISLLAEEEIMTRRRLALSFAIAVLVAATTTSVAVAALPMGRASQQEVHRPGDGVTLPVVLHQVKPEYTAEAMQQKIQGSVYMAVVVTVAGDVTDVEVTKSLDAEYGLDNEAVRAAGQWKFKPGMKDGKPVAVRVELEMRFALR